MDPNMSLVDDMSNAWSDIETVISEFANYQSLVPQVGNEPFPPQLQSSANSVDGQPLKSKRARSSYTAFQVCSLEKEYIKNSYLNRARRIDICTRLNMTEKQVKVWFQNRRMKEKKLRVKFGRRSDDESTSPGVSDEDDSALVNNLLNYKVDQRPTTNGYNGQLMHQQGAMHLHPLMNYQHSQFNPAVLPAIYNPMQHQSLVPRSMISQVPVRQELSRGHLGSPVVAMQYSPVSPQQYYSQVNVKQENSAASPQIEPEQVQARQELSVPDNDSDPLIDLYNELISSSSSSSASPEQISFPTSVGDIDFDFLQQDQIYPEIGFNQETQEDNLPCMPDQSPTLSATSNGFQDISPVSSPGGGGDVLTTVDDFDVEFVL